MSGINEVTMKAWLRVLCTALVFCMLMSCLALPAVSPATSAPPTPTSAPPTAAPTIAGPTPTTGEPTLAATATTRPKRPTATQAAATQAAASQLAPTATAAGAAKPNIVFILADDLDAAEIQYMPKLKALIADQGLTFSNYSVAMSLCCPSRATTLRGQYPHNTQILGNTLPTGGYQKFFQLGEENSTIATWLQAAGYKTMLAGKYLNDFPIKTDPMHIPPGWNEWYSAIKGDPYGEFNYTLNENGTVVPYGSQPQDYGTDVYFGKALDFIGRSLAANQPFFTYIAPYAPHAPYTPAPRHADLFPGVQAPRTPNYNEADVSDKPAYIRNRLLLPPKIMDKIDTDYRHRLQALQAVDEGIAAVVAKVQAAGQLNNTYFFFTSDNGYHLGNHRQIEGKIAPYEEELRVTMIVRGPGVPAGVSLDQLVGNLDLAPTWADIAGASVPSFVDGRSLLPLMGANPPPNSRWRQVFSIENGPDNGDSDTDPNETSAVNDPNLLEPKDADQLIGLDPTLDADLFGPVGRALGGVLGEPLPAPTKAAGPLAEVVPSLRGLRTQTLSYVEYVTGEVELYDLVKDPYELTNLAASADPKVLAALSARVKDLAACQGAQCRMVEDEPLNLP